MFNSHNLRKEQPPTCRFPMTKLKNISCVFCRHQFYVRDFVPLKDTHVPLLLSCGHPACQNCAKNHTRDPCPLCKISAEPRDPNSGILLPANVYVFGLMNFARARPVYGDEPNIAFSQAMTARMKQCSIQQGFCIKCGMPAVLRCLQCDDILCHMCSSKVHSKLKAQGQHDGHLRVMLTDINSDPLFEMKMCVEHTEKLEYFCEECSISACCHCMLFYHKHHTIIRQTIKNQEYMADFQRVHEKLAETMQRIRQAQKKVQKALVFSNELQNSETIEAAINQHFAHLHGVLQNVEARLIDKLYGQRDSTTKKLTDIQQRLKYEEEQVQSGLLIAAAVNELSSRVSLKEVITKLEKLADAPCHVVGDLVTDDEKIMFSHEPAIVEIVENHCKLELPEAAGFNLLTRDTLPMDYEMEPLVADVLPGILDETFSLETSLKRTSSCLSVASRRPEVPELKQKGYNLVHACYIESPSNFYVRLAAQKQQTIQLERQLSDYAENKPSPPQFVKQDKIYAVKRSGERWFRGRVVAVNVNVASADTYEVFNLDYGKTESNVTKSRIRSIPAQIALKPQTVIYCALYDIVPKDGKWRSDARQLLTQFLRPKDGRALAMYIVKVESNTYFVDICKEPSNDATGSLVSIRDCLIFSGHGSFVTSQQLLRTSPQAVRRFFREDLALETYFDVKCSHVESPDCIYVQKAGDHLIHLATLMSEMSVVYNEVIQGNQGKIHVPEIGLPCAVEKAEGAWCRAIINGVPAPQMVEVHLVDFGSKISTNYEKIRKLHENYMISPGQAIKVSLADIKPRDGHQWSKEAIEFTKEFIEEKLARVVAFEKSELGYNVALYINEDVNFAATLASRSYAISTGPRSYGVAEVQNRQSNSTNKRAKVRNSRTVKTKKSSRKINGHAVPSCVETSEQVDPYRVRVKIIRAESPDTIYVADLNCAQQFQVMMQQMQKLYNAYQGVTEKSDWEVDFPCVVYSPRDQLFCRGIITAINPNDEAQVFLYDLAFTETVPIGKLQALKKKFCDTPAYAFKVKLAGISPCGGSSVWTLSSCQKLKDLINENQNSKFYISKIANSGEGFGVELYVEQIKIEGPLSPAIIETNSINRMLVDSGLALPIKQFNEKTKVLAIEFKRQISRMEKEQRDETLKLIEDENLTAESNEESDEDHESRSNSSGVSVALSDRTLKSSDGVLTSWLPAEEIIENTFIAEVTYVDHDCCLHLHPVAQNHVLRSMEETMEKEYSNLMKRTRDYIWKKGDLCIAQYHSNKKWYRAQVREVKPNHNVEVEFIDYGSIEMCEVGTLRKHLILTQVPSQRTKCVIAGIYPNTPTHKWRTRDLDIIHSLVVEKRSEITILKRMEDHLQVSIVMLYPMRRNLIDYLVNELHLDIRVNAEEVLREECSASEIGSTVDDSCDVIIEGYIDDMEAVDQDEKSVCAKQENDFVIEKSDEEGHGADPKKNSENVEKGDVCVDESIKDDAIVGDNTNNDTFIKSIIDQDNVIEKNIDDDIFDERTVDDGDIFEEKNVDDNENYDVSVKDIEADEDYDFCEKLIDNDEDENKSIKANENSNEDDETTLHIEVPTVLSAEHLKNINFSNKSVVLSPDETSNLTNNTEDIVLSGSLNFTHVAGDVELSRVEAMDKLETISLPDSTCLKGDELVASTPFNESLESEPCSLYKQLVFPDELKVIKAQGAVIGRTESWLHVLDNNNSELVTSACKAYVRLMADMQKHAKEQPALKRHFEKGTPCCLQHADGQWYRAIILDWESSDAVDDTVTVRFVDWGDCAAVNVSALRAMKEEWFEVPCMSVECKLWGVEETPAALSNEFNDKMWTAYGGNATPARPVYVKLMDCSKYLYDVQIYRDKACTKLIYESLINEGYFTKKKTTSD